MDELPGVLALASRQWSDYVAHRPGSLFENDAHATMGIDEAYRIQRLYGEIRCSTGDRLIGYKVGNSAPKIQTQLGFHEPIHGRLFATERHESGVLLDPANYADLAVEAELAVQLDDRCEPCRFLPVIELHNYVLRTSRPIVAELIANNGINAGVVFAPRALTQSCEDWGEIGELAIRVGERVFERSSPFSMPGGPAAALAWLEGNLRRFRECLAPGDIVLLGTPLGLYPVRSGDAVQCIVDGEVCVTCGVG